MFSALNSGIALAQMATMPVPAYVMKQYDSLENQEEAQSWMSAKEIEKLREGVRWLHAGDAGIFAVCAILMDTDGKVLSRTQKAGTFVRCQLRTGKKSKSVMYAAHSIREALEKEVGISFRNPAIVAVSPPCLSVRRLPEDLMKPTWRRGYTKADRWEFGIRWVQYFIVAKDRVQKLSEPLYCYDSATGRSLSSL